LAISFNKC